MKLPRKLVAVLDRVIWPILGLLAGVGLYLLAATSVVGGVEGIHLDAFAIFAGIGLLGSMLLKTLWFKGVKFFKHVKYLRSLAGGTFSVDAEAQYWLDLIKRRDYRRAWRWHFGEKWKKEQEKRQAGVKLLTEKDKKRLAKHRKIRKASGIASCVLVLVVVAILVVPQLLVVPRVRTQADIFLMTNASVVVSNFTVFDVSRVNTSYDVTLTLLVQRTDKIIGPQSVTVTVRGYEAEVYDSYLNATYKQPTLYGVGFGKVNETTLTLTEFTIAFNQPDNTYTYTFRLDKMGSYDLVYIDFGINNGPFSACTSLATVTVQGSEKVFGVYEYGCYAPPEPPPRGGL